MKRQLLTTTVRVKGQIEKIKKPTFDDFKSFNEKFSIVHDFIIRVIVICTIVTLGYFLIKEITTNKYVLTSIGVANSIKDENGKNTKIYPEDLKQNIILDTKEILGESNNIDYSESDISESISGETMPLNIAGFDLNQLYLYLRSFFKMQNRELRAYLMKTDDGLNYKLLLNVGGDIHQSVQQFPTTIKEKYISTYLAKEILLYNSPYKLGLFLLKQNDSNLKSKTKYMVADEINKDINRVISYLAGLEKKEHWWEKLFQDNRWKEKREYLQVLVFSQQNSCRIDSLKYTSVPNYSDYKELLDELNNQNNQKNKPFYYIYEMNINDCKADSLCKDNADKLFLLQRELQSRIDTTDKFYKKYITSKW